MKLNAEQECDNLMNSLLPTAQNLLSKYKGFHPYGGFIEPNGQIRHVSVRDETTEYPDAEDLIETLENLFKKKACAYTCTTTVIICDVRVKMPGSEQKRDAIRVRLDHEEGYSTEVFFPYEIVKDEICWGEIFAHEGKNLIFRDRKLQ